MRTTAQILGMMCGGADLPSASLLLAIALLFVFEERSDLAPDGDVPMNHRAHARHTLEDTDVGIFYATAPLLATVFLLLLALFTGMGIIAALAWQNDAEATAAATLLALLLGGAILLRFLGLRGLLMLLLSLPAAFERILARWLLPDPYPPASAHDRLRRAEAMRQARRRLRRLGLGAGWIGPGAAILDRHGRVRLLRRP
jgi:hypothetical protein